eukprot:4006824-Ditylum_brightwellii.AAC.1
MSWSMFMLTGCSLEMFNATLTVVASISALAKKAAASASALVVETLAVNVLDSSWVVTAIIDVKRPLKLINKLSIRPTWD